MQKIIGLIFSPLAFGIGFLSPLFAQVLTAMGVSAGLPNLVLGLAIGVSLGLIAQFRGSWIWVKPS